MCNLPTLVIVRVLPLECNLPTLVIVRVLPLECNLPTLVIVRVLPTCVIIPRNYRCLNHIFDSNTE